MAEHDGHPAGQARKHYGIPGQRRLDRTLIALGTATVSPINMANAYATIANGGRATTSYVVEKVTRADDGEVLYNRTRARPTTGARRRHRGRRQLRAAAGRPGTAPAPTALRHRPAGRRQDRHRDQRQGPGVDSAWFVGYTPQLDDRGDVRPRQRATSSSTAGCRRTSAPTTRPTTWTAMMERDMEGLDVEDFPPPAYVDGDAPTEGHEPPLPPRRPPTPTRRRPRAADSRRPRRRRARRAEPRPRRPPSPTPTPDPVTADSAPTPVTHAASPRAATARRPRDLRPGGPAAPAAEVEPATSTRPWTTRSSPPSARASAGPWASTRRPHSLVDAGAGACSPLHRGRFALGHGAEEPLLRDALARRRASATRRCATPTCPTSTPGGGLPSSTGRTPTTPGAGRYEVMEYPVGISYFAWGAAWVTALAAGSVRAGPRRRLPAVDLSGPPGMAKEVQHLLPRSTRCCCSLCGLLLGLAAGRGQSGDGRGTRWPSPLSPALLLTGLVNWDLLAVLFWSRVRSGPGRGADRC